MWLCKKQYGVSLSTMKEFISASQAGQVLFGLKEHFGELKMRVCDPMPMWVDKQAAIKQLESEQTTSSAKHVDKRFKFIRHYVQEKVVQPRYIKCEMADILTKSLPAPRMKAVREMFKFKATLDGVE